MVDWAQQQRERGVESSAAQSQRAQQHHESCSSRRDELEQQQHPPGVCDDDAAAHERPGPSPPAPQRHRVTLQRSNSSYGTRGQPSSRQATSSMPGVQQQQQAQPQAAALSYEALTAGLPERSLLLLRKRNPIRVAAVLTVNNRCFDMLMLAMIVSNCITLAMYSHRPGFDDTRLGVFLAGSEYVFVAVFALELVLKVLAQGLCLAPGTYLRDGWNLLDAAVVVLGFVDLLSIGNVAALRAVRVLRPLRTITKVKGLKVPVVTLLKALPMLSNVALLCCFFFFMFGIIAVQLFAGALQNRCAAADLSGAVLVTSSSGGSVYSNVTYLVPLTDASQMCSGFMAQEIAWQPAPETSSNSSNSSSSGSPAWSGSSAGGGWVCPSSPSAAAPHGMFCAASGANPNSGMTSFDNVLWAWLTIFQCITQEGWTDIMYALQDAVSPWVFIYFVALIIFGSFFLVNLALAVLFLQFSKEFSVAPSASAAVSRSASMASGKGSRRQQAAADDDEHLFARNVGWQQSGNGLSSHAAGGAGSFTGWHAKEGAGSSGEPEEQHSSDGCVVAQVTITQPPAAAAGLAGRAAAAVPSLKQQLQDMRDATAAAAARVVPGSTADHAEPLSSHRGGILKAWQPQQQQQQIQQQKHHQQHQVLSAGSLINQHRQQQHPCRRQQQPQPGGSRLSSLLQSLLVQPLSAAGDCCRSCRSGFRAACQSIIQSGWFSLFNLGVILANTAVMAATTYPEDPAWQSASDLINVCFSCYFVLELVLKLIGLGPRRYIKDNMNRFDALVVVASLVEVILWLQPGHDASGNSLSVLRSARLLRVFKLARSWHELNRIISGILRSFGQVMWLSLLLLLFVFVFALMGMQLFGYSFASCSVPGAVQLCPPGMSLLECPAYPDCFAACDASQAATWISTPGSPYNNLAYCEQFPRNSSNSSTEPLQYWAQVGKASMQDSRFDNIGWAALTVFQIMTTENWNTVMYSAMVATHQAAALWFVAAIVLGNYILLNLFLAVLLENFGAASGGYGNSTLRSSSNGSTLAAAANAVLVLDWLKELLERSYVARLVCCSNRVHVLHEDEAGFEELGSDNGGDEKSAEGSIKVGATWAAGGSGVQCSTGSTSDRHSAAGRAQEQKRQHSFSSGHRAEPVLQPDAPRRSSAGPVASALAAGDDLGLAGRSNSFLNELPPGFQPHRFSVLTGRPRSSTAGAANLRLSCEAGVTGRVASAARLSAMAGPAAAVERSSRSCTSTGLVSGALQLSLAAPPALASAKAAAAPAPAAWVAEEQGTSDAAAGQQQSGPGQLQSGAVGADGTRDRAAWAEQVADFVRQQEQAQQAQQQRSHAAALHGCACGLLGPDNRLRRALAAVAASRHFENAVLLLILLSSLSLALDTPGLDPASTFKRVLVVVDMVFVVLFALEALLKILVKGFVTNGPGSYLRSPWNMLDFAIVIVGIVMMAMTLAGSDLHSLASLRALRTMRALRPLRVASRLEGMRVVVNSLFASLPPLGNVCLVCLLFYVIFAIMTVDLLAGSLYACQDSSGQLFDADYVLPPGTSITRQWCEDKAVVVTSSSYHAAINVSIPGYTPVDRQWINPVANFDNVINAIVTLFSISTTELWVTTMFSSIAAVGVDQQPVDGHNPALAIFFVVFIIFGGFFVLQLFVSVTIEKMHQKQGRGALLTTAQEEWLTIQRMMAGIKLKVQLQPPPGSRPWRVALFRGVMSDGFEKFVLAIILVNVVILALTHANMSAGWQSFMSFSNLAFTAAFTLEAAVKLVALGPRQYLRDNWCRFDLAVVLVSVAGVAVDLGTPTNVEFLPLLRALRAARIFRLIPKAEGLRTLLHTLWFSLPALGNIAAVLCLFFFIFAVIGMNLFGALKWGAYVGRQANFSNVLIALLTLFRMITGESWDGIMQNAMVTTGCLQLLQDFNATASPAAGGAAAATTLLAAGSWLSPGDALLPSIPSDFIANRCSPSPVVAVLYFCSFVLLCGLVLVNFVIGVIIDNMQNSSESAELPVNRAQMDRFVEVWSELDPHASQLIPVLDLAALIRELPPPLGVKGEPSEQQKVQAVIMSVEIPFRNNQVHFLETLHALAGRVAGTMVPEDEELKIHARMWPRLPSDQPKYIAAHFYAALHVQAAVRGFLRRHALRGASAASVAIRQQLYARPGTGFRTFNRISGTGGAGVDVIEEDQQ